MVCGPPRVRDVIAEQGQRFALVARLLSQPADALEALATVQAPLDGVRRGLGGVDAG